MDPTPDPRQASSHSAAPESRGAAPRVTIRRLRALGWGLVLLVLGACGKAPHETPPVLVLLHAGAGDPAEQGWRGLVSARVRALGGLRIEAAASGCQGDGVTHTLGLSRRTTARSEITALELIRCADGDTRHQSFVTPREARSDWSRAAAWWVARELGLTQPEPGATAAVGERSMLRYLSAIGHLARRTSADVAAARSLLRESVREEPTFAAAHAELAVAELLASEYGLSSTGDALAAADLAIRRALELEPDNGLAWGARGLSAMVEGRYREAVPILLQAHRREPGHDAILLWLGNAHLYAGEPAAARPWLETVVEINPDLPSARISLGEADCLAGAEPGCQEFLAAAARTPMQSYVQALLLAHGGDHAGAIERLEREAPAVDPGWVAGLRGDACRALARADCARPDAGVVRSPLPDADLWQLDLGYGPWLRDPATRLVHGEALRAELDRLRAGGIRLAVLDAIERCLDGRALAPPDLAYARLLSCAPEAAGEG